MSYPARPLGDRFWAKVDRRGPDECWPWLGAMTPKGYGLFGMFGWRTRKIGAHRFAYTLLVGRVPRDLEIDHLCRNRGCVNPAHMEPVTQKENTLRGVGISAQNARKTVCLRGHPFDEVNTHRDSRGVRKCRTCRRVAKRLARKAVAA